MRYLTLIALSLLLIPFPSQATNYIEQFCGCTTRIRILDASLAFKGTITHVKEHLEVRKDFPHYLVDVTFDVEEIYRGLPEDTTVYTIRTDSSSCGFGRILFPYGAENEVGGTFGVFTQSQDFVDICNSVMVDESWFGKIFNPFVYQKERETKRRGTLFIPGQ